MRAIVRMGFVALLAGCSQADMPVNPVAEHLDVTGQSTSRYHVLAEHPFAMLLAHEGYVVSIEKVPRERAHTGEDHAYDRLIRHYAADETNSARAARLDRRFDDEKVMIVTHVIAYDGGESSMASPAAVDRAPGARFLYNVYAVAPESQGGWRTDAGTYSPLLSPAALVSAPDPSAADSYAERGLETLKGPLRAEIEAKLDRAARSGRPYTHLLVGAMGWDNDQEESVRRYNALISNLLEAARRDVAPEMPFRPLVIGITWPSVWGWPSWFDLGALAYKLVGYGNKADDADEVGYTIANYLLNGLALDMKTAFAERAPLRVVAFGHSFGARMMSRALFSDQLLRTELRHGAEAESVDLFVALQGAFSINRFIEGGGEEGWPYAEFADRQTAIVLTTSRHDEANPLAFWLSRAKHVGGAPAFEEARNHAEIFAIQADSFGAIACVEPPASKQILMVDAQNFVKDHNDVLDIEMGELMWSAIRCFAPTASEPGAMAAGDVAITPAAGPAPAATGLVTEQAD